MEFQSYNAEIALANICFKRIFSNIKIVREQENGKSQEIAVNCVLATRSRILKNLQNPEQRGNYKLPIITINMTGFSINGQLRNDMHNEIKHELTKSNRIYDLMTPVPITLSYEVSLIGKYPQDIEKICDNFIVFFNPDRYVSFEHPKYEGQKLNCHIVMDDSVNYSHPDEFDGSQDDITTATFSFSMTTFLFAGVHKAKLVHPKILSTYTSSFLSNVQIEIAADKIDEFQKNNPNTSVYALSNIQLTTDINSYVDDISSNVYDNVPIIGSLDVGFYAVPSADDISGYMESVDNELFRKHVDGYCSAEISSGYVAPVDKTCSLNIFRDKIIWGIDNASLNEFPNNFKVLGH